MQIISQIKGKNIIAVMNKNDLETVVDKMWITKELGCDIVEISAATGEGKEALYDLLNDKFFSRQNFLITTSFILQMQGTKMN